jgi:hypothetical protein
MRLSPVGISHLLELRRRRPAGREEIREASARALAMADEIRAIYYPKQRDFFRSAARWKATRKTRRMGATTGGCREFVARALSQPGFRATYATTTRQEAIDRAWRNDNATGMFDVMSQFGDPVKHPTLTAFDLGGVIVEVREADLKLEFSNGSQIEMFGAENLRTQKRKRGNSKHAFWIDEAQDFPDLERFFDSVVIGSTTDFQGEVWLTGTPGVDCAGMFYEVTKELEVGEDALQGWEVHEIAVVDNPYFGHVVFDAAAGVGAYYVEDNKRSRSGPYETAEDAERAAIDVRWDRTAGEAKRLKGWNGTEPDFVREWLGKWVKEDARYVYPVHAVPEHALIVGPPRPADNPFVGTHPRFDGHPAWYDHHAAMADLPRPLRGRKPYQWMFGVGADFGYHPDPFAIVVWAFNAEMPDVFEMFSWKCTRVHTDDQGAYLKLIWDQLPNVVSFVGDPAGKQDDFEVWRTRMNLPIEEANKRGKNTLEEFLASDIRRSRVHLRKGSPLHQEMRHLVYLPTKPGKTREVHKHRKINGIVHGDHCCDCARYSYADLTHYLSRMREDKPPPGTRAALEALAEKEERSLDDAEELRARLLAEGDEMVREYGGGYDW